MNRYSPKFREGDLVLSGKAIGYQGTFLMKGDIDKFPDELEKYVRNVYYKSEDMYEVEFLMVDEPHLFQENYDHFYEMVDEILRNNQLRRIRE